MQASAEQVLEQLEEAITDVLQGARNPEKVYFDDEAPVMRLCFMLEKTAHHGLKTGMFSRTTVWQFLRNLDNCLPGGQSPLEWVVDSAKTEIGLTRVFFRYVLNEGVLDEYMRALFYSDLCPKYYQPNAMFVQDDTREAYLNLISPLAQVQFRLFLKEPGLNDQAYWKQHPEGLTRQPPPPSPVQPTEPEVQPTPLSVEEPPKEEQEPPHVTEEEPYVHSGPSNEDIAAVVSDSVREVESSSEVDIGSGKKKRRRKKKKNASFTSETSNASALLSQLELDDDAMEREKEELIRSLQQESESEGEGAAEKRRQEEERRRQEEEENRQREERARRESEAAARRQAEQAERERIAREEEAKRKQEEERLRREAEQRQEELRLQEEQRKEEELRQKEEQRREEERQLETKRKAEEDRQEQEVREKAEEEARQQEEQRRIQEEEEQRQEEQRLAQEEAQKQKELEERQAQEEAERKLEEERQAREAQQKAEEMRQEEEREAMRVVEEQRRLEKEAEERRLAEQEAHQKQEEEEARLKAEKEKQLEEQRLQEEQERIRREETERFEREQEARLAHIREEEERIVRLRQEHEELLQQARERSQSMASESDKSGEHEPSDPQETGASTPDAPNAVDPTNEDGEDADQTISPDTDTNDEVRALHTLDDTENSSMDYINTTSFNEAMVDEEAEMEDAESVPTPPTDIHRTTAPPSVPESTLSTDQESKSTKEEEEDNSSGIVNKISLIRGAAEEVTRKVFDPNSDDPLDIAAIKASYEKLVSRVRDAVQSVTRASLGNILYADNYEVTKLCFAIESVLKHGIMQVSFFGTTTYWDYLVNIANCMPDGQFVIQRIRQTAEITTDVGRGRAWIRVALNDKSLGPYLKSLLWEEELTSKFYHAKALMREEDEIALVLMLLESLSHIEFRLTLNDARLNSPDCWELLRVEQEVAETCVDLNNEHYTPNEPEPTRTEEVVATSTSSNTRRRRRPKNPAKRVASAIIQEYDSSGYSDETPEDSTDSVRAKPVTDTPPPIHDSLLTKTETDTERTEERLPSFTMKDVESEVLNLEEAEQYIDDIYSSPSAPSPAASPLRVENEEVHSVSEASPERVESEDPVHGDLAGEWENRERTVSEDESEIEPVLQMVKGDDADFFACILRESERVRDRRRSLGISQLEEDDDWLDIVRKRKQKQQQAPQDESMYAPVEEMEEPPIPEVLVTTLYSKTTQPSKSACSSCGTPFGKSKARFCYYTGKYFCTDCHLKEQTIIPARVVHNWNFSIKPVSHFALLHLRTNKHKPLLRVVELNRDLYLRSKQLKDVLPLRQKLWLMRHFVETCRHEATLLQLLGYRTYMLNDPHVYSMNDLVQQYYGRLIPALNGIIDSLLKHIREDCETCKGKGDYCEICNSPRVIFAFETDKVRKCPQCQALYHSACFVPYKVPCPKCERMARIRRGK